MQAWFRGHRSNRRSLCKCVKSCRQCEFWVWARTPGERMTAVGSGKASLQQTTEECWFNFSGANRVKRFQEKCDHNMIPLPNVVGTSSLHLVSDEVEENMHVRWKRCPEPCIICPYVWNEDHSEGHKLVALWPTYVLGHRTSKYWIMADQSWMLSDIVTDFQQHYFETQQSQSQYIHQLIFLSWLGSVSKTWNQSAAARDTTETLCPLQDYIHTCILHLWPRLN